MNNWWSYEFMQIAIVAALFTGISAPAIGTFLVHRRLALFGDGLGHVALTGVALGLLTNTSPLVTAVFVAVVGAIVVELLRARTQTSGDVALAMIFYGGIAGGVMLTNLAGESAATLNQYLFGSITTMNRQDLVAVGILAALVIAISVTLAPQFFAVCQDPDHARVSGVPVGLYTTFISVLAAITITVAMRTVGLLLVSALMVIPVATAGQLARGFRSAHLLSMLLGVIAAVSGVIISFEADTQPGPSIVLLAMALFVIISVVRGMMAAYHRRRKVHRVRTDSQHEATPRSGGSPQ